MSWTPCFSHLLSLSDGALLLFSFFWSLRRREQCGNGVRYLQRSFSYRCFVFLCPKGWKLRGSACRWNPGEFVQNRHREPSVFVRPGCLDCSSVFHLIFCWLFRNWASFVADAVCHANRHVVGLGSLTGLLSLDSMSFTFDFLSLQSVCVI